MQSKIKSLIGKTLLKISLNEQAFFKNEHAQRKLATETEAHRQEIAVLKKMIADLNIVGVVDKTAIVIVRRRQAALRRKIASIEMQIAQKELQAKNLFTKNEQLKLEKRSLNKKKDKYDCLVKILRQKRRLKELFIEEADAEEKINGNK